MSKRTKTFWFLCLTLFWIPIVGMSQTTVLVDFEVSEDGYAATGAYGSGFTDLFNRTDADLPNTTSEQGFFWGAEDLDSGVREINIDQIDITSSTEFSFSIDMLAHHFEDWDEADELLISYSLNGGSSFQNLMWVQMVPTDAFNGPAAIDTGFDGEGDCGNSTTLPALSTGTQHGCIVGSSDFENFSAGPFGVSGNTTLDIRIEFIGLTSGDEGIYIDNIEIEYDGSVSSDPEPTNYPTLFSCMTQSDNEINLSWTDATGTDLPDGYLIKWSDVSYASISNPTDLSDSNGPNSTTVNQGIESASISGLNPNTQYFFKIWSYSNSGSTIDYKTSPAPPQTDCTTDNGPCFEESFDGIAGTTGSSSSYLTRTWIGDEGISITATDARRDQTINGSAATIRNGSLTISSVPGGIGELTLTTQRKFSGGTGELDVFVNGLLVGVAPYDGTAQTTTITGINTGGTFDLVIDNVDGDRVAIDDLNWTCFDGCTPTHNITSFLPTSGPAGTLVTISGSGFTGATAASFSGTASPSIQVIDDNTLIAEVPENATSGAVGITVAGCEALSASSFTVLTDNGTCGASGGGGSFATDLFISEVYDAGSGSLSYIEIFNGTNASVNLSTGNYEIEIETGSTSNYALSGTLASGDTYIVRLGSSPSSCSNFSPDLDLSTAPGFNGDDQIYLLENSLILDYAPNPNYPDAGGSGGSQPGFSQARNGSVTGPSTTYIAADWTIGTTENCNDLGIPPFVPNGSEITINSQPQDVDCAALTFSLAATATPGFESGAGAYTWRYNEPGTDTWEAISTLNAMTDYTVTGAGTNSITITGSTANLLNYQFYVDMGTSGSPQCRVYSNAAQYTYDTRAFYRTNGNGSWTEVSNWQMSDTEFGTYVTACQYPTESGSSKVNILSGDSIFLDNVAITIDELDVNANGVLAIGEGGELFVNNGNVSGADFIINGTYYDQASSPDGIEFNTAATWEISPSATIIKTNNSSVSRYRDNYESGIANIPATANWIYRREGNNDVSVASTGMFYPNLTFENNLGPTYDPTDVFNFFQGSSSSSVIKGDLNVGGTGSSNYVVRTNNTNASTILIQGDLIIQSGSTFTNEDVSGTDDGTGIEVLGDLVIGGALQLQNGASGRGQLILTGTGDQIGIGDGISVLVNDFEINKPSGAFFTEFSLIIAEEARFISGIYEVDDAASNPADVEFSIGSSATGMSNASFIDGRVDKFGSSDFTFPIGDTNADGVALYEPARIFALTGTGGFSARYFAEAHPNAGLYYDGESNNPDDYQEISNCDFWNIDQVTGFTANARIGLTYTNPNNLDGDLTNDNCNSVTDPSSVFIARWNEVATDWEQPISEGSTTGASESTSDGVLNPSLGGYGDFTLTSNSPNFNVLPITLLSFRAEAKEQQVITDWITAAEINNDYFTIERSKDGNLWEKVGTVDGAGDSHSELSYSFADDRPYSGISYYRLRQTDYDGATTLSEPRAVEIRQDGTFGIDKVYRGQEGLNLVYHATAPYVVVEIYDLLGKRIHGELLENSGNGFGTIYPDLAKGAYLLRMSNGQEMATEKFVW